jgi:hypothetical protein
MKNLQQLPTAEMISYAKRNGKKEAFLYNNRIYSMYINPSQSVKAEYNANWAYIKSLPNA